MAQDGNIKWLFLGLIALIACQSKMDVHTVSKPDAVNAIPDGAKTDANDENDDKDDDKKNLPILKLVGFQGLTGTTTGDIILRWQLPASLNGYAKLLVARNAGTAIDAEACSEPASVIKTFDPPFTALEYTDQTGAVLGETFSYAVCVVDAAGKLIDSKFAKGVIAADTTVPAAVATFSAQTGTVQGDVSLSLAWLPNIQDVASVKIVIASGDTAPADCNSGTAVYNKTSGFVAETVTVPTGHTEGETVSFRVCVTDKAGNVDTTHTATGVMSFDGVAPAPLATLAIVAGALPAHIDYSFDMPSPFTDYARVELRMSPNGLPAPGCNDGSVVQSFEKPFTPSLSGSIFIEGQDNFGFRACIYDGTGNVTDSDVINAFYVPGCGAGQYSDGSACVPVGSGFYSAADDNDRYTCSIGYFCSTATNNAGTGNGPCDAGYYCPVGSVAATEENAGAGKYTGAAAVTRNDCAVGRYCQTLNNVDDQGDGPCTAGYFCPAGSTLATQEDAGAGKYTVSGATVRADCAAGRYCQTSNNTTDQGDGACDGGRYCLAGSTTSQGAGDCTAGYYCPAGSATATENGCPIGSYCPAAAASATACTNKPSYSVYDTALWTNATCPWECNAGHTEAAGQCLPNCVIDTGPAALTTSTTAAFTMTCTNIGTVQCSLDGGAYAACTTASTHSLAGLAAGAHTLRVRSTDGTITGDYDQHSWTVDATPPTVNIDTATIVNFTASFVFSYSDPQGPVAAVQCRLNGAAYGSCTTATTQSYASIGTGAQTFDVRVTDTAGNTATDTHTWNTGAWAQTNFQNCSTVCTGLGKTNVPDPDGSRCTSGEIRSARAEAAGISFVNGTWGVYCVPGGATDLHCTQQNFGNYCYTNGQGQDADPSDWTVGCFCR